MDHLTKKDVNFCETAGLYGVIMSLACLFQHLYFMIPGMITITIIGLYMISTISFVMLMKKSTLALLFLAISTGLILLIIIVMALSLAFSLVLILFFIYLVVITAIGFSSDLQKHLRAQKQAEEADAAEWAGKI